MKILWTLLFLILMNRGYSQDSVAIDSKLPWLSIKAMPFPLTYGVIFGYGYIGLIKKRLVKNQSICVGTKFMSSFGGTLQLKNRLLLLEYRYYLKLERSEAQYISPYIKLRDLYYSDYEGAGVTNTYNENSLGLGLTYGHTFYLNKKKWLELNTFVGGGYLFNIGSKGSTRLSGFDYAKFEPSSIYTRFDLRLGFLLGFNFR